jgi:alcohol dehydrogenase class IV
MIKIKGEIVMNYSMMLPKHVLAGPDSIAGITDAVASFSAGKALLVTDQGVREAGLVDQPVKLLTEAGVELKLVKDVPAEPEIGQVEEILQACRKLGCAMVIGIGGGSVMDTAKILAALIPNDLNLKDLLAGKNISQKGLPTLMAPTTAGTGSEATPNAIVTLPEQGLKMGIVSSFLMVDWVILDPGLTVKLPPAITASTGIDALAHALECYISKKANPFSDTLALAAIRLICGSIRRAYSRGDDLQARHNMLLGSFYGGMCIATSGTTAVHALAYPLGGKYKIPHGVSNAMLLPHVMEFNQDLIGEQLLKVAGAMGLDVAASSQESLIDLVIKELYGLIRDLKICTSLKNYGITENDLPSLVEEAAKVTRLLDNNPKPVFKEDMYAIYRKLL